MTENIKKVKINEEKCIGCGACSIYAPEAFDLDPEKGKAVVKEGAENTDEEKIKEAAQYCPVQAIEIEQ
ncbi:ferredoxin [Patescibacteria group bacterium]|nr:ferredoxin [Patescibacteria group bacterium]